MSTIAHTQPTYDPGTALIVVDVQNDFADPGGNFYVVGGEQVVAEANREIDRARQAGALVVYTQDWHPERTPHFETDGGVWPVHCVGGTPGAQFHPDLTVDGPVVRKGEGGEDAIRGSVSATRRAARKLRPNSNASCATVGSSGWSWSGSRRTCA